MLLGQGRTDRVLSEDEIRVLVAEAFEGRDVRGLRVLVIIPDTTRTAPSLFSSACSISCCGARWPRLDYLVALGTHPPLSEEALERLVGVTGEELAGKYAGVHLFNHAWDHPKALVTLGTIPAGEIAQLSGGLMCQDVAVTLNRLILAYDLLVICGPTFPHEVVGFSGGNKYFFPGISGPEVINFTHWLGAVITSYQVIGTRYTPVRAVIDRAAAMIERPKLCFSMVVAPSGFPDGDPASSVAASGTGSEGISGLAGSIGDLPPQGEDQPLAAAPAGFAGTRQLPGSTSSEPAGCGDVPPSPAADPKGRELAPDSANDGPLAGSQTDVPAAADGEHLAPQLAGLFIGAPEEAYAAGRISRPAAHPLGQPALRRVLSVMPAMYDDIWTAAKGMYKLKPAVADGGEVIIYAPHIDEISYTHGQLIDHIGYHCRDYFLKQWDRFKDVPAASWLIPRTSAVWAPTTPKPAWSETASR